MHDSTGIFRALADPSRRAIYEHLARGELPVKEVTAHFPISQPAVSQHLRRSAMPGSWRNGGMGA